jgi:hypothetical protein
MGPIRAHHGNGLMHNMCMRVNTSPEQALPRARVRLQRFSFSFRCVVCRGAPASVGKGVVRPTPAGQYGSSYAGEGRKTSTQSIHCNLSAPFWGRGPPCCAAAACTILPWLQEVEQLLAKVEGAIAQLAALPYAWFPQSLPQGTVGATKKVHGVIILLQRHSRVVWCC